MPYRYMHYPKTYLLVLVSLLAMAGCSKNDDAVYPADGGLAFYNASQVLRQEVEANAKHAQILLNSTNPADTTYGVHMPDFIPSFGGSESQQFFPRKAVSVVSPPWLGYMRIAPGLQQVSFMGTDSSFRLQTTVQTFTDRNICLFLSDSVGEYQVTQMEDNSNPGEQAVQLKVIHLSPDAGALQIKVNDQDLQQLTYRSQTEYAAFDTPSYNETFPLRVQVIAGSDLAGRITINATPGHSYTLIINGYYSSATYTNRHTGAQMNLLPDFRLSVVRNK